MKPRTTFLSLVLLTTMAFPAFAQNPTQTIKGRILDKDTRQPLIGATVVVATADGRPGAVTDTDGKFELPGVPVGRHRIAFQYLGYEPYLVEDAILNSAKELFLEVELVEQAVLTEEVVITARAHGNEPLNELSMVSTRSFSVEETQRYAASANDPSRMAVGFPGVQANRDARSDIIIRGNSGIGLLWRLEGIDIPNPNHFARKGSSGGGITIFSVSMLSNSDFSTGAFPAEYGNAFSGVFDIKFRNGNMEKREYTFRAGMLGLDFSTEGPIKKGRSSYLANYRYSTLGILDAMDIRLVDERESNRFQDLSFKLQFNSENGRHITSVWGIGGLSDEFFEAVKGVENWETYTDYQTRDFDTDMGAVGVNHNYLIDDKSYLRTGLAVMGQKVLFRNDTLTTELQPTKVNDELYINNRLVLSSYYNRKLSSKAAFKGGFIASRLSYDLFFRYLLGEEYRTYLDEKGHTFLLQPYASLRLRPHVRWTINLGLHAMYFDLNGAASLEPRLGIRYQASEAASFSLAYGLHSRILPIGSYFTLVPNGAGGFRQPNMGLKLIRAHHFVLGYDQLLGKSQRLRLEAYYQRLFDVPVSIDPESTFSLLNQIEGYATRELASKGTGSNIGLDITYEQFFTNGTFFIAAASLFNSTYEPLNGQTYDTRYNSQVLGSFMGGKEWPAGEHAVLQTGLRILYSGGQRITPILSPVRDPFDPANPLLDESRPFSVQVGDYFRPDLRAAYRRDNQKNAWYIALDVQNFISRNNDDALDYNYDPDLEGWVFGFQSGIVPVLSFQIDL
ncbi:MAG: TonB-dependent receptor [Lewinellaceae bacterium]|nr:TonB-dependent receptor [Lewinellaceae bacterium]